MTLNNNVVTVTEPIFKKTCWHLIINVEMTVLCKQWFISYFHLLIFHILLKVFKFYFVGYSNIRNYPITFYFRSIMYIVCTNI
ncbi:unnamed protein product [Rhizophagus irregularis]|nr:unnamed protein product [Rhizophagus irregularis]